MKYVLEGYVSAEDLWLWLVVPEGADAEAPARGQKTRFKDQDARVARGRVRAGQKPR